MTIAELHGKLAEGRTGGYEYMEDLLTSDVFGTMRYAGWECGFLDWLARSQAAPVQPSSLPIYSYLQASSVVSVDYRFWPLMPAGREPDLALLIRYTTGTALLVLVEVKYLSGMSDWEGPELDDEAGLTGDQIADQVWDLAAMRSSQLLDWFEDDSMAPERPAEVQKVHLLVTAHTALPAEYYARSARKRRKAWPVPSYWLSWRALAECLEPYLDQAEGGQRALISDLYRLLQKKDLVRFRGFQRPPWQARTATRSFWVAHWWSEPTFHAAKASRTFWSSKWWTSSGVHMPSSPAFWREPRWWAFRFWQPSMTSPCFWMPAAGDSPH